MKSSEYQHCTQCLLDNKNPYRSSPVEYLHFDEDGKCPECQDFNKIIGKEPSEEKRAGLLSQIIEEAKRKGSDYDCAVGFSGGKDSSYLLYKLKKEHNMNILAVTLNTCWTSEYGLRNQEIVCDRLGIDQISYKPDRDFWRQMSLLSLKDFPFCRICNSAINAVVTKIASNFNVPLVVSGVSPEQTAGSLFFDFDQLLQEKTVNGEDEKWPFKVFYDFYLKLCRTHIKDKKQLAKAQQGLRSLFLWGASRDIRLPGQLRYYALAPQDEADMTDFLEAELGWEKPPYKHADCEIAPLSNYIQLENSGFSLSLYDTASFVRMGKLPKDEGEKLVADAVKKACLPVELARSTADKLGISYEDFLERLGRIPKNTMPFTWPVK